MDLTTDYGKNFFAHLMVSQLSPGMINYFFNKYSQLQYDRFHLHLQSYRDRTAALYEDMETLLEYIVHIRPECMPAHRESGLAFLRNLVWTPKGARRETDKAKQFTGHDLDVLHDAHSVRLVDYHAIWIERVRGERVVPIYGVRSPRFAVGFTYTMTPWQSGGLFEVVSHAEGA